MWTVGHSTRSLEELVTLLRPHGIRLLVDVRRMPRSRRHPQFAIDSLATSLPAAGIAYAHAPALGGLRRGVPQSRNTAWRNASFRAYADHMQTPEFAAALDDLLARAATAPTVIMCAEALWWRCHRSLIADAAVARGVAVEHIVGPGRTEPHRLRSFARVVDGKVTYPGDPDLFAAG